MSAVIARTGYQNFGSFHVENVEHLIAIDPKLYVPPPKPFGPPESLSACKDIALGRDCRALFLVDFDKWTFINHGAFGGVCKPAFDEANQWREHCEKQPLKFLDRELFPQVVRVMRELAGFVNARPQDLVFLPNATTGLNIVLQSCQLQPGEAMYLLNIGYGSVKKMMQAACHGAEVVYGDVTFPIKGPEDILELVARTMPPNTKLAVFDSVTSNTALVLPVTQLIQLCRSRGVQVLIDGAHALGQLPLDITALNADYFVTNCHKWLAAPRGSALMWVHPDRKAGIKPLVVSHGSGCGYTSDFIWDGCRDYAPYLGTSSALHMWKQLGLDHCQAYMHSLLTQAVALLTQRWSTSTLAPLSMCASMALVQLPPGLAAMSPASSTDAKHVQDLLHFNHHVECPVKCIEGGLYARISAQIYNVLEDYEQLAEAVASIASSLQEPHNGYE